MVLSSYIIGTCHVHMTFNFLCAKFCQKQAFISSKACRFNVWMGENLSDWIVSCQNARRNTETAQIYCLDRHNVIYHIPLVVTRQEIWL